MRNSTNNLRQSFNSDMARLSDDLRGSIRATDRLALDLRFINHRLDDEPRMQDIRDQIIARRIELGEAQVLLALPSPSFLSNVLD